MGRDEGNSEGSYDIMISLILSILFWCMPEKKELGIAAIVATVISSFIGLASCGLLGLLDVAILIINIVVYNKGE